VKTGLRESARTRAVRPLGLCLLLLLVGAGPLFGQDSPSRLFPESADHGWPGPSETASSTRFFPAYRLLPEEPSDREPWMASAELRTSGPLRIELDPEQPTGMPLTSPDALALRAACPPHRLLSADSTDCERRMALADLTMYAPPGLDQPETEVPRSSFLERHRLLFSTLIPVTAIGAVTANSLVAYNTNHRFRIHREGWFGDKTVNGGADKASHLVDYYIVASLFEDAYKMIGYSDKKAILLGLSLAVATGLANEVSDGFTRHGFSWEDLAMDSAGAVAASLVSVTRTRDLFGMRTSHLPGPNYGHDVYSADFKFSGLGQRLGVNLGPLRWLLFSVTYGSKGYREKSGIEKQRQLGLEVGLNLQQVLFDLKVTRSTWWGYALHVVGDNVRFPFTAVGMRLDLNSGKWRGPNNGNYD
jgi:uncharacterized protein YfiM (DUF2279 family)